eukprot:s10299_g1.t1
MESGKKGARVKEKLRQLEAEFERRCEERTQQLTAELERTVEFLILTSDAVEEKTRSFREQLEKEKRAQLEKEVQEKLRPSTAAFEREARVILEKEAGRKHSGPPW